MPAIAAVRGGLRDSPVDGPESTGAESPTNPNAALIIRDAVSVGVDLKNLPHRTQAAGHGFPAPKGARAARK
jgi:hypothetical protein